MCLFNDSESSAADEPMVEPRMGRQADHDQVERALARKLHNRRCCMTGNQMTMQGQAFSGREAL